MLALQEQAEFRLKLLVQGIAAIGNARARSARAELARRRSRRSGSAANFLMAASDVAMEAGDDEAVNM